MEMYDELGAREARETAEVESWTKGEPMSQCEYCADAGMTEADCVRGDCKDQCGECDEVRESAGGLMVGPAEVHWPAAIFGEGE